MGIGSDGSLNGVALEVTIASRGFAAGHRFTNWRDLPEGVPVRSVAVAEGRAHEDGDADLRGWADGRPAAGAGDPVGVPEL